MEFNVNIRSPKAINQSIKPYPLFINIRNIQLF